MFYWTYGSVSCLLNSRLCALNVKDLLLDQDLIKLMLQSQNLLSFRTLNSQGYCHSSILISSSSLCSEQKRKVRIWSYMTLYSKDHKERQLSRDFPSHCPSLPMAWSDRNVLRQKCTAELPTASSTHASHKNSAPPKLCVSLHRTG